MLSNIILVASLVLTSLAAPHPPLENIEELTPDEQRQQARLASFPTLSRLPSSLLRDSSADSEVANEQWKPTHPRRVSFDDSPKKNARTSDQTSSEDSLPQKVQRQNAMIDVTHVPDQSFLDSMPSNLHRQNALVNLPHDSAHSLFD